MSKIGGKYTARELLSLAEQQSKPLIENFIYDMDHIMLVGKEKANKSTLALQICCHLSSGEPLFGQYNVPEAIDCVYIQAEGKLTNTGKNLANMTKVIPIDLDKLLFLYYPAIHLNTEEGLKKIKSDIDSWKKPRLIVIDPLYQSMGGKIEEQQASSLMTANLRHLSEYYQCAILLLHHSHRPKRKETGDVIEEGDDAVFGSFVWKAFPDTVLLINKVKGHATHRRLSCETQRMGNVVTELDLVLIEPEPFYLQIKEGHPIDHLVFGNINVDSFTIDQMVERLGKTRGHVANALWRLQHQEKIEIANTGHKPILWRKKINVT